MTVQAFDHRDRDRTIHFGRGTLDRALEHLPERFTLLTTRRALKGAPAVADAAAVVVEVPGGQVNDLAADLRECVPDGETLVALGGGRVIDTAKAIAAAGRGTVAAIPTSLSAAEMTGIHRHARGVPDDRPRVRPGLVINDPTISASQPVEQLAASSANALAHAIAAFTGNGFEPVGRAVAAEAVVRLAGGWSSGGPDRDALALGALLAGWAVDHTGLGPHHAVAQTAVRQASLNHAEVNAALLPVTVKAMRRRENAGLEGLDAALGRPVEELAEDLRRQAAGSNLQLLVDDPALLASAVETAAGRPELRRAEPPFGRDEVAGIYRAAAAIRRPASPP